LAVGFEQFMGEITEQYPNLTESSNEYDESKMHITPPVDPLFRVGELGLGYDTERDRIVLVAREVLNDNLTAEEAGVVRFWCSRSQVSAMCNWALEVISHGRAICPQCGEAMDPAGHFCPKKNGHKH
jgi:uncharacterized repeat protein (TIGR03847 family)